MDAAGTDKQILYIAMLTTGDGNDFSDSGPNVRRDVVTFFEQERQKFAEGAKRNIGGLQALLSDRLNIIDEFYVYKNRGQYFQKACEKLTAIHRLPQRVVVLLDPDVGIQCKNPDKRHVCVEELELLWSALAPGDVVVIYQHLDRSDCGLDDREALLRSVTKNPQLPIERLSFPGVTFFKVRKGSGPDSPTNPLIAEKEELH